MPESLISEATHEPGPLPLAGVRVVEFTHMVMGPTCGMILADLGAEVVKVEPLAGDNTRRLLGSGAGFFSMFNRNKHSLAVDVTDPRGREIVLRLAAQADVFSENFKAGVMDRLGFGAAALAGLNPRLVYVSHKGFLPGPYDKRTALDEVVQMMGGLAYMTGPEGQPLRAGSSVNDIMGGMFGAIGALAALQQRDNAKTGTGRGQEVHSALFENNVFLVAQHMMQFAVTGQPAAPMPSRISAWGVYDVFTVKDGEQIFLAAVSDTQWALLCREFGFDELRDDSRLATNNDRVRARDWLIPALRQRMADFSAAELAARFEATGGHPAGFRNYPGGQLVQETDMAAPVRGARIVLHDDLGVRADMTAAWLAQMGWDVLVVEGLAGLRTGAEPATLPPLPAIDLAGFADLADASIIDLAPSPIYAQGHIPGALFAIRSRLDMDLVASVGQDIVLTSPGGALASFAAAELAHPGYRIRALEGGTNGYVAAGGMLESGDGARLTPPGDVYRRPYEGTDNPRAAMQAYLDWEYGLVAQLERDGTHGFTVI